MVNESARWGSTSVLDLRVPSNYGHGARASAYEARLAALPNPDGNGTGSLLHRAVDLLPDGLKSSLDHFRPGVPCDKGRRAVRDHPVFLISAQSLAPFESS